MSNQTKIATATTTQPAVIPGTEIAPVQEMNQEIAPYSKIDAAEKREVDAILGEIDMGDRSSIIFFGSKAQEQMSTISERMLEGVRNKDLGSASTSLNEMVVAIKGFDIDELNPNKKPGFFARLFGKAKPIALFMSQYSDIKTQINEITDKMEGQKTQLLTDIVSLDKLYDANLDYFHKLELYISAGEEKLTRLDNTDIPALLRKAQADTEDLLAAQALRDLRSSRDDLERRLHDLRLTRQVAMQSLPSIRLVQENDKTLINKINSTLINTVPLWKNQLAQAVTIFRMSDAAETVKQASDLTNELLESNATNLQQANVEVRTQMERGIFDIESVRKANETLVATINDSLRIADEGKAARAEAEIELKTLEGELREALISSKAKADKAA
ncbi:MAG: toxic anion resistance protein [Cocleimonas sp.]|nr:toxic anion resistance protein [Cocleimonas sp.]